MIMCFKKLVFFVDKICSNNIAIGRYNHFLNVNKVKLNICGYINENVIFQIE